MVVAARAALAATRAALTKASGFRKHERLACFKSGARAALVSSSEESCNRGERLCPKARGQSASLHARRAGGPCALGGKRLSCSARCASARGTPPRCALGQAAFPRRCAAARSVRLALLSPWQVIQRTRRRFLFPVASCQLAVASCQFPVLASCKWQWREVFFYERAACLLVCSRYFFMPRAACCTAAVAEPRAVNNKVSLAEFVLRAACL